MQFAALLIGFVFLSGAGLGQWAQGASDPGVVDQIGFAVQTALYGSGIALLFFTNRRRTFDGLGTTILLLCCGWVCLSTLWSGDPAMTLRRGVVFAAMTAYGVYVGTRVPERVQVRALIGALACTAVASLVWFVLSPDWAVDGTVQNQSLRGVFITKNVLGRSMQMGAVAAAYMLLKTKTGRPLLLSALALFCGLLYASGSVTSFVGVVISVALILALPALRTTRYLRGTVLTTMIALTPVAVSVALASNDAMVSVLNRDSTLTGRVDIWEQVVGAAEQQSLVGYGYQAFWAENGPAEELWLRAGWRIPNAHNGLLDVWLDLGLVGVVLFTAFLALALARSVRYALESQMASAWPCVIVVMLVMNNVTESTMMKQNSLMWVLAVAALTSSLAPTNKELAA